MQLSPQQSNPIWLYEKANRLILQKQLYIVIDRVGLAMLGFLSGYGVLGFLLLAVSLVAALYVNRDDKKKKSSVPRLESRMSLQRAPSFYDGRVRCSILYGTQTGTAERFAKSLKSQLESKYGATTAFDLVDLEHYDGSIRLSREKIAFFLVATYGDGEPTDSSTEFFTWLSSIVDTGDDTYCQNLKFAVFGLGNRQYEHFCAMGKRLQKDMLALGAAPIAKLGEGDDDGDIDEDFEAWSTDLFTAIDSQNILTAGEEEELTADAVPSYDVEQLSDVSANKLNVLQNGNGSNSASPHLATITAVRELHTPASDRSCVHVEVDISGCNAAYEAGDHIAVYAENSDDVVEAAAEALRLPLDLIFRIRTPDDNPDGLPEPPEGPMTLEFALARYADLLATPSKAALKALAAFAVDAKEAERLRELSSIKGRDAYRDYIVLPKRSLLEILQEFPSVKPTLGAFFGSIAPRLQPRFYSISSSPALHPRSVHITCAVVKDKMPTGRIHHGIASSWLAKAKVGDRVLVFLRSSTFKLPKDPTVPIIMVGPGTGLAPFRGFIQERASMVSRGSALGDGVLYFGCRNRDHDYIYQEELEGAVKNGALSTLFTAFSRQGAQKDYVQHHIAQNGSDVWKILGPEGKGYLYVCGDAKRMAKDVNNTLVELVAGEMKCSTGTAEAQVKSLLDSGRYLKDVW